MTNSGAPAAPTSADDWLPVGKVVDLTMPELINLSLKHQFGEKQRKIQLTSGVVI